MFNHSDTCSNSVKCGARIHDRDQFWRQEEDEGGKEQEQELEERDGMPAEPYSEQGGGGRGRQGFKMMYLCLISYVPSLSPLSLSLSFALSLLGISLHPCLFVSLSPSPLLVFSLYLFFGFSLLFLNFSSYISLSFSFSISLLITLTPICSLSLSLSLPPLFLSPTDFYHSISLSLTTFVSEDYGNVGSMSPPKVEIFSAATGETVDLACNLYGPQGIRK
jgi:hypothetical protein